MENNDSATSDNSVSPVPSAEMESLARETDMPLELVQEIYLSERDKFERTYVPVLIRRHVKALLRERRACA
jgi:hypothetical protein